MPIKIEAVQKNGVCIIGSGDVTGEDLYQSNLKIYSNHELINKYNYQIINFLDVESLNISYEMIEKITAQDKEAYSINPNIKMVCVTDKENIFNLMKMWESFVSAESFETKVVRSLEEAYDWLKVTPD